MIANATQLLVTLACGLPKPFCYSLTRRSFSLWLFLLSLLLTLLSSPTIPAGTLPPHSIKSVSPPHTDTTLLSSSSPPLSPLYPIMPWGWNRKKTFSFIYKSLPVLPSPSSFPCCGLSSNAHTDTHMSLARRGTAARCQLLYGRAGLFLLIADSEARCGVPCWPTEKQGEM